MLAGGVDVPDSPIMVLDPMTLRVLADEAAHPAYRPETTSLNCRCNIGATARKLSVKCAIAGCHYQLKMTLAEREELRRVGRENNAATGLVCPAHVKAAFNFEFDDIDIDVPMGEFLVEASKDTPRWRVMLTPLPGRRVSRTANPRQGGETGLSSSPAPACSPRGNTGVLLRGSSCDRHPVGQGLASEPDDRYRASDPGPAFGYMNCRV